MKYWLFICVLFFVAACAHHKNVRPGTDGIHLVVLKTDDTDAASEKAIAQANYFCEKRDKSMAVLKENEKYTGDMDEKEYKQAKKVTKAVQMAGWGMGGKLGGAASRGGYVASQTLGDEYRYIMKFKCI